MARKRLAVFLTTKPSSIGANEITDNGRFNQRAAPERRRSLVERLYGASRAGDTS